MTVLADIRTGAKTALDNTSALLQTATSRPASIGSTPFGWVDEARLGLEHSAGVRSWDGEVDIWLVASSFDNAQEMTTLDTATAQLLDYVSDNPHICGTNTVIEPVRFRLTTAEFGEGVSLPASVVTLGRFVFQEGR